MSARLTPARLRALRSRTTEWLRFRCSGHPDTCPAVALVRYRALEEALEALR